jgi:hypothetical protein
LSSSLIGQFARQLYRMPLSHSIDD